MRATRPISCAAALGVILSGLLGLPAAAAEPDAAVTKDPLALPAVDGLNGKLSLFGGVVKEYGIYGAAGSIAIPLGFRYGLQIDGIVTNGNTNALGDVTIAGTAAHLFWRDPSVGLFGIYGDYVHANAYSGVDVFAGAAETALYLGRFTLEGLAGAQAAKADLGSAGTVTLDARFFTVAQVAYYPLDNLKLSVGYSYQYRTSSALMGAEWGLPTGRGIMASLFARGSVSEHGNRAVLVGLRFYFGRRDKTLIRRNREDDPTSLQDSGSIAVFQSTFLNASPGYYCFLFKNSSKTICTNNGGLR